MQELMFKHSAMAKSKIKLDLVGQSFSALKETLLKFKGSFFFAMLNSERFEPGEYGAYFIDRSPTYFSYVIDYLRRDRFDVLPGLSKAELQCVKTEFDFYQIDFPLQWDTSINAAHLAFMGTSTAVSSQDVGHRAYNQLFMGISTARKKAGYATAVSSQDVDCFRMKIEYQLGM
jgi:hypothetical protein